MKKTKTTIQYRRHEMLDGVRYVKRVQNGVTEYGYAAPIYFRPLDWDTLVRVNGVPVTLLEAKIAFVRVRRA